MTVKTPDPDWPRLKNAVADALEVPPDGRDEALRAALVDAPGLLPRAQEMLQAASGDDVLHSELDTWMGVVASDPYALVGQYVGPYLVDRLIAEGGMGAVYAARQLRPDRLVALKVLRPGLNTDGLRLRFGREVAALARLDHPHIAHIFDAGVHAPADAPGPALPYLAMQLVDGETLTAHCRNRELPLRDRLALLATVADAVHFAHQKAVIHRDLKPGNILVTDAGEPVVLDFGVARFEDDADASTQHTTTGALLGTLAYMAPEQLATQEVDARCDVYALGAVLHELVTGRPPVDVRDVPLTEAIRRLNEDRKIELGPQHAGDLTTIVRTALARDPDRRYAAASDLAGDLRRYLRNDPITAEPPTTRYLLTKFAQRHRGGLVVASLVGLALAVTFVAAVVGFAQANHQRGVARAAEQDALTAQHDAEQRRADAESAQAEAELARADADERAETIASVNAFLRDLLASADPDNAGRGVTVLEAIDAQRDRIDAAFVNEPLARAELYGTLGWVDQQLARYDVADAEFTTAIELFTEHRGAAHEDTLNHRAWRLIVWLAQSRLDEADAEVDDALALSIESLGIDHPTTLTLRDHLAEVQYARGEYDQARMTALSMLDTVDRVLDPSDPLGHTLRSNAARLLSYLGDYDRAIAVYERLVELADAPGSETPPLDASIRRLNLASAYAEFGRADEALPLMERAVADLTDLLGEENDQTLIARSRYAETLLALGRKDEAIEAYRALLADREAFNGPNAVDTAAVLNDLAVALMQQERYAEALPLLDRVIAMPREGAQVAKLDALMNQLNRANALSGLGRHAEAVPIFEDAVAYFRKELGADNFTTVVQTNNLGMAYHEAGEHGRAVETLAPLLDTPGLPPNIVATLHRNAGRAALAAGRYGNAEAWLLHAYQLMRDDPAGFNARTARFLVELYDATDRPDEAARYRDEAEPDPSDEESSAAG